MVRKERLELSHLVAPEPVSGASKKSYATSANYGLVNDDWWINETLSWLGYFEPNHLK